MNPIDHMIAEANSYLDLDWRSVKQTILNKLGFDESKGKLLFKFLQDQLRRFLNELQKQIRKEGAEQDLYKQRALSAKGAS